MRRERKKGAEGRENWHKEGKINRINAYPPGHEFGLDPPPPMDARNFVHIGDTQVAKYVHTVGQGNTSIRTRTYTRLSRRIACS